MAAASLGPRAHCSLLGTHSEPQWSTPSSVSRNTPPFRPFLGPAVVAGGFVAARLHLAPAALCAGIVFSVDLAWRASLHHHDQAAWWSASTGRDASWPRRWAATVTGRLRVRWTRGALRRSLFSRSHRPWRAGVGLSPGDGRWPFCPAVDLRRSGAPPTPAPASGAKRQLITAPTSIALVRPNYGH